MAQTQVYESFPIAVPGMVADDYAGIDITTCIASEDIPAGRLVVSDGVVTIDGRRSVKLATGATLGEVQGISVYRPTQMQRPAVGGVVPPAYQAGDAIPVMRAGRIWCEFEGTNVVADQVLNVTTTGGAANRGSLTGTAADATHLVTTLKAKKANVGLFVLTEINIP